VAVAACAGSSTSAPESAIVRAPLQVSTRKPRYRLHRVLLAVTTPGKRLRDHHRRSEGPSLAPMNA
jgi:hypothetical protein